MDAANLDSVSGQNLEIELTVRKERRRLLSFIRTRVKNEDDAQDILQGVFGELIEAYRGLETIERATAWLFRVARYKCASRLLAAKCEGGEADETQLDAQSSEVRALGGRVRVGRRGRGYVALECPRP